MNLLEGNGVQSSAQSSTTGRTGIRVESTISYTAVQVRASTDKGRDFEHGTGLAIKHPARLFSWGPLGGGERKLLPPRKSLAKQLQPDYTGPWEVTTATVHNPA